MDIPPQHVTLLGIFNDQHQLINTVDFVFDTLNQRTESVGDIIDKGVRNPVGCYRDVIFELLDSASDVLRMGCTSEVELFISTCSEEGVRELTESVPSLNTIMYMFRGSR